jgi:hypothetical protein
MRHEDKTEHAGLYDDLYGDGGADPISTSPPAWAMRRAK